MHVKTTAINTIFQHQPLGEAYENYTLHQVGESIHLGQSLVVPAMELDRPTDIPSLILMRGRGKEQWIP